MKRSDRDEKVSPVIKEPRVESQELRTSSSSAKEQSQECDVQTEGLVIWPRVPETTLPRRQLYRAFICENVDPVGRVRADFA